jgi:molybdopterin-guanine dinucleotide biosynthesis protein MobB
MIPTVSIVAKSGTGKTTFIEKLIPVLIGRGLRIGVLKHAHHIMDIDHPGKDSYRHREAGASEIILNSPNQMALIKKQEEELPLTKVLGYFNDVDLVLIEGYKKDENLPKIEIFRKDAGHKEPLFTNGTPPLALVTDQSFSDLSFPVFSINDTQGVADLIREKILHKKQGY